MERGLNIGLRTAHIGAVGVVPGDIASDVAPERIKLSFRLKVGTVLVLAEASRGLVRFPPGRGVMAIAKLGLPCAVPRLKVRLDEERKDAHSGARVAALERKNV